LKGLRSESRGLDLVQTQVDELLPLKNKLDELRKRVKEFKRAINDILNNDEDMLMICQLPTLMGVVLGPGPSSKIAPDSDSQINQPQQPEESELTKAAVAASAPETAESAKTASMDLEMLFENYLNEVEWISAEIEEIMDEVTNTEGI